MSVGDKALSDRPIIIVVHGIGRQAALGTLKSFIDGATARFDIPSTSSRAQLAYELQTKGTVAVEGIPFVFKEFNYARAIGEHLEFAEADPRLWVKSCRNRLREINRTRGGPANATFIQLKHVVDDLLLAGTLARLIAGRLHVQTDSLSSTALGFLQQVQLYVDYPPYRDMIASAYKDFIVKTIAAQSGARPRITLVTHSLGTVVTLRVILEAARADEPWVNQIDGFVTFGSPIDLFLVLFPEIFSAVEGWTGDGIKWTNYTLGNDPIATDLALARSWVAQHCPKLFVADAPEEVDLGTGSIVSAHTDYWHNRAMLDEICSLGGAVPRENRGAESAPLDQRDSTTREPPRTLAPEVRLARSRSVTTAFKYGSMVAAAVVAWLILVWWEENVKPDDGVRVVLGSPLRQVGFWVAAWGMVISHICCWSRRMLTGLAAWFGCAAITTTLVFTMPGLPIPIGLLPDAAIPRPLSSLLGSEAWGYGNLVLFLVPLSAALGVMASRRRSVRPVGKGTIVFLLAIMTVGLSLFIGTRQNPSNLSAEFGVLSLALGLWWLGILLARIDDAFASFVGGRRHLDVLSDLWKMARQPRPFRRLMDFARFD